MNSRYIELRHKALILKDRHDYLLNKAEMNPAIYEQYIELFFENNPSCEVIWEPFAGHNGRSIFMDMCSASDISLVAYDICPSDPRVQQFDSTVVGPPSTIGGMVFHPPYFSTAIQSGALGELSLISNRDKYIEALTKTAQLGALSMADDGLVLSVARSYRCLGKHIRLDEIFLEVFNCFGFELERVWSSEPDVALILRKKRVE